MGKLKDLVDESQITAGPKCTVSMLLDQLDDTDGQELVELLAGDRPTSVIARALVRLDWTVNGRPIASQTLGRHRKGECSCR